MAKISKEIVEAYALRAQMSISEEEMAYFIATLTEVDKKAARLAEVDTSDVVAEYFGHDLNQSRVPMMNKMGAKADDKF